MRRDHWELPFRLRLPDAWVARAACAGMEAEVFFPGRGGDPSPALAICEVCPVTAACLDYALANCERFGVWGGTTEKERRSLKQRSRRSAVVPMEGRRNGDTGSRDTHGVQRRRLSLPRVQEGEAGMATGVSGG